MPSSHDDRFHWVDYLIFSLMLMVSCAIGVYHGCRKKHPSQAEYLMGNRKLNWFPVAVSLAVSYTSGVSQLGKPVEIYLYGIQYIIELIGTSLCIVITMYTFVPMLYKLQLTSSYEYLELRFQSKLVRRVGSLIIIISQLIYFGIATYAPAIALEAVTGFPVWTSMLCIGIIAMFYTMLGGLKAVVWTDAFQCLIMVAGTVSIIIVGLLEVGGFKKMWITNWNNERLNSFNFDPSPTVRLTFWGLTIGAMFSWLPFYAVNQTSVQRYSSVPTLRKAKLLMFMNLPLFVFLNASYFLIGLIMYSYFSECDPIRHPDPEHRLTSPNQMLPVFVMRVMGWPGVPGVFLAAIFSGSLSTVSSALNSLAAITWEDFFKWKFDYLSETTKTRILKIFVLTYGFVGLVFAFLASQFRGHILQVSNSFLATSSSPLMGLYILGAFFTKTNWLGAIVGGFFGLAFPMWMSLGSYLAVPGTPPLPTSTAGCAWNGTIGLNTTTVSPLLQQPVEGINKLYTVSFMWFPTVGTLTTVLVGLIVSVLTAPFIHATQPDDISKAVLIFPLDCCGRKKQRKKYTEKQDALDLKELKEFTQST